MRPFKYLGRALSSITALLLLMLLLTIPLPVQADVLYDYTYTGKALTAGSGANYPGGPSNYSITVTFTSGALVASTADLTVAYTISDGVHTYTAPDGWTHTPQNEGMLQIYTLASNGTPATWAIAGQTLSGYYMGTDCTQAVALPFLGTGTDESQYGNYSGPAPAPLNQVLGYEPGSWTRTEVATPLPPSAFLLGSGLIPLAWARRKKRLGK